MLFCLCGLLGALAVLPGPPAAARPECAEGRPHAFVVVPTPPEAVDICRASGKSSFTSVLAPSERLRSKSSTKQAAAADSVTKYSTITVTYVGSWPAEARTAFDYAAALWEEWLVSSVPIEVVATWTPLSAGVLASAKPHEMVLDLNSEAIHFEPVALHNAVEQADVLPGEPDIEVSINSAVTWSYTTEGTGYVTDYDLVSTVMHEIGHGVGFRPSFQVDPWEFTGLIWGKPSAFGRTAYTYDEFVADGEAFPLLWDRDLLTHEELQARATSGSVWWNGVWGRAANDGSMPRLYAPTVWEPGSSISHLDEATYPAGNINSLMSPLLGFAEVVHYPGPIALAMLADMGWGVNSTLSEPRPDILARVSGDQLFTGNNVYNETADDTAQTVSQTVDTDVSAIYDVVVQNDSHSYDLIALEGGGGYEGWDVRYSYWMGHWTDMTATVTGPGMNLGLLPAGDGDSLQISITPSAATPGGKPLDVILIARSGISGSYDRLRLQTTKPPISAVTLAASPGTPQLTGTPIILTATPTGGGPCTYTFSVRDASQAVPGEWQTLQEGAATTCVWRPAFAGSYQLMVSAQDGGGPPATDRLDYEVVAPFSGVTLNADPASPQAAGTPVRLTASPVGGLRLEYRFTAAYLEAGVAVEQLLADWSASSSVVWTPALGRRYELSVEARDGGDPAVPTRQGHLLFDVVPPLTSLELLVLPASPQLAGTAIHVKGTPTGGQYLEYQLRAAGTLADGSTVDESQAWTRDALQTWTPQAGVYTLTLAAREVGQTNEVTAQRPYTVVAPLTSVSLQATPQSPQLVGTPVTLSATADGGFAPLFAFEVGQHTEVGWVWTTLQRSSSSSSTSWTPNSAGSYLLRVTASDTSGSARATTPYEVCPPLSGVALRVDVHSPQRVGTSVPLAGVASGGAQVEYRFELCRRPGAKDAWAVIQEWSPAAEYVWTPQSLGYYRLRVLARERGSMEILAGDAVFVVRP